MITRLRLTDAVAIGAGALLCLKVVGFAGNTQASDAERRASATATPAAAAAPAAPRFGQALTYARTNYQGPVEPKTTGTLEETPAKEPANSAAEQLTGPAAAPVSSAERALLERLGQRREEWQQKGRDLELREKLIENAERKLENRINELKSLEEKSEAAAAKRGDSEAGALRTLVTMYETMKPKEAARVFDRLPHDVLVPVVLQMNPRKMAEVLAVMAPESAEKLTIALAQRPRGRNDAGATGVVAPPSNELPGVDQVRP